MRLRDNDDSETHLTSALYVTLETCLRGNERGRAVMIDLDAQPYDLPQAIRPQAVTEPLLLACSKLLRASSKAPALAAPTPPVEPPGGASSVDDLDDETRPWRPSRNIPTAPNPPEFDISNDETNRIRVPSVLP